MATIQDLMQEPAGQQGLIGRASQQSPEQIAQEAMPEQAEQLPEGEMIGEGGVDPQEQDAYERVVVAGMKVISGKKSNKAIMSMIEQMADDPAQALAEAASVLILQLDEKSGGQIPESVILPAAAELLEEVAEFANEAGKLKVDQPTVDQATELMITRLAGEYGVGAEETQAFLDNADPALKEQAAARGQPTGGVAPAQAPAQAQAPAPAPAQAPAQPTGVV